MPALLDTTPEWKEAVAAWRGVPTAPRRLPQPFQGFQVLQNRVLERVFGTSHWVMPGLWFLPIIGLCLWDGLQRDGLTASVTVGCVLGGILTWTLVEYVLHRWLFHLPPMKNPALREIQYMMHGYHHDFPDDPGRLVAPPILSWPLALVVGLLHWVALGELWTLVFAGTLIGYLAYDWMHYYTHHAVPKTRMGRFMRRFHLEHHYRTAHSQFGLSSPLWDLVFGSFWTTRAFQHKRGPASSEGGQD